MADDVVKSALKLLKEDKIFEKKRNTSTLYNLLDFVLGSYYTTKTCKEIKNAKLIRICLDFEKNIDNWDDITKDFGYDHEKSCHAAIYWLYGKLSETKPNVSDLYYLYKAFETLLKKKCFVKIEDNFFYRKFVKSYDMNVLKNKKYLHDFLEHFDDIKTLIPKETSNENKKTYCGYIKYMTDLYQKMLKENGRKEYCAELIDFEKKFKEPKELEFIKKNCNDETINILLNENSNVACSLIAEQLEIKHVKPNRENNALKDVAHYELYKEFNKDDNKETYKEYCSKVTDIKGNTKVSDFCKKLARNLINVTNLENREKRNIGCSYFIHWVYDELMKISDVKSNYSHNNPIIKELYNVVNEINMKEYMYKHCYVHFDYTLDEWKDWKVLHDYFMNYKCNTNDYTGSDKEKCKISCEQLIKINELYAKYIKKSCTYFSNENYFTERPEYFNCDQKYNPYNLYLHLKCDGGEPEKVFEKVEPPQSIEHYSKYITEKSEEQRLLYEKIANQFRPSKQEEFSLTSDPFYTAVLGVLGLLGVSLVFFVFYKFTPLGSRMHGNPMNVYRSNYEEFEQEMLEQRLRSRNMNPQNARLNIAYQGG
ncbi:PIR protein [Plasmodium vivax]|nr:PIR protein [Plasmodium vivax]